MYNVLANLRPGEALNRQAQPIHELGLVSVLPQLHDELDAAVFAPYGWYDHKPEQLRHPAHRLVALNVERAAEEATGHIRWLRPEFQNSYKVNQKDFVPSALYSLQLFTIDLPDYSPLSVREAPSIATALADTPPRPPTLPELVPDVADQLSPTPLDEPTLAARFTGKAMKRLPEILPMLAALGRAKQSESGWLIIYYVFRLNHLLFSEYRSVAHRIQ